MCLQPLLEGNGISVKKTGEYVVSPGFNILATANTKGKGDETGSFAHTGIMNEAMLDRFPVTLEQPYADPKTETKILEGKASNFGVDATAEANFISDLVQWADNIRKTYMAGGMSEIVTTRRLESILEAFSIFGKHTTAIEMGISRFDGQTKSDMIGSTKISGERTESNTRKWGYWCQRQPECGSLELIWLSCRANLICPISTSTWSLMIPMPISWMTHVMERNFDNGTT